MTPEIWRDLHRILNETLNLPSHEREIYVIEECGQNQDLAKEIFSLLELENVNTSELDFFQCAPTIQVHNDQMIGPYRLEKCLGMGGMGEAWLATRDDGEFQMQVALKFIRRDLNNPALVENFRRERQTLARLKHPNIASLYDGGTTDEGLSYLVMAYIEGLPIDRYCRENRLSLLDRLRLFQKTCEAVDYAHGMGVIHRDIKPGNILVSTDGEPKLLDFGISHDKSVPAATTIQLLMMTPDYASPEQAQGQPAGPASDVYSLGVLLYELLTGKRPYDLKDLPLPEVYRTLTESEPTAPSKMITEEQTLSEQALFSKAQTNSLAKPEKTFAALDYVLLKALKKETVGRYASAADFTEGIRRLLAHLPVVDPNEKPFDAILLCAQEDFQAARKLAEQLASYLTMGPIASEGLDSEKLDEALDNARCCILVSGSGSSKPWDQKYLRSALATRVSLGVLQVQPVLLPGAQRPQRESELPRFLRRQIWETLTGEKRRTAQLAELIEGRQLSGGHPELYGTCPFRGLASFLEEDRQFFFGREAFVDRLTDHMSQQRFLAAIGSSGSGKSSVIQAGLIPRLRTWGSVVLFTPGAHPLEELAFALFRLARDVAYNTSSQQLLEQLKQDEQGLYRILAELETAMPRVFLVIDQFEEVLSLAIDRCETDLFMANLLYAAEQRGATSIVLTMRSDFIGKFAIWPDFSCFIMDHVVLVESMNRDQMAQVIEMPARLVGLSFEAGLVERILNDLTGAASELPMLEHALLELYYRRRDNSLVAEAYDEIGGIEGALTRRAENEFALLDEVQQEILRKIFVFCLIQPGEGTEDTRRRATMAELLAIGGEPECAEAIVSAWIQARLLTSYRDEARNQVIVDVAHEALIRRWHQIGLWMSEDRETARQLNNLRQMTSAWKDSGQDQDLLPRGVSLARLIDLVEREGVHLTPDEKSFVEAGCAANEDRARKQEEQRKRELRSAQVLAFRARLIAIITLSSMLILALFAWWVVQREKRTKRKLAESYLEASGQAWKDQHLAQALYYDLGALQTNTLPEQSLRIHYQMILNQTSLPIVLPHQSFVWSAAFNSDGTRVVTSCEDNTVRIWDTATGLQIGPTMQHESAVGAIYNRDFSRILSWSSGKGEIRSWNPENGQLMEPVIPTKVTTELWVTKDNRRILSVEKDEMRFWDMNTLQQLGPSMVHPSMVHPLVMRARFSPDDRHIISSGPDHFARLWDATSGSLVAKMEQHDWIKYIGFSGNGDRFYTVGRDQSVGLWESKSGQNVLFIPKRVDGPNSVLLNRDGSRLYLIGNGMIKTVDEEGNQVGPIMFHAGVSFGLFNRNETKILSYSHREVGTLRLWDTTSKQETCAVMFQNEAIWGAMFNSEEDKILSWGRSLRVWDAETGDPLGRPLVHDDFIEGAVMDRDGKRIVTWSYDGTARLVNLASILQTELRMKHEEMVHGARFSKTGKRILSWSQDGTARLWDSHNPNESFILSHGASVNGAIFNKSEERVLTWGDDKTVRLWNSADGRQILPSMSANGEVLAAVFDRAETRIISLTKNNSVALWNANSGNLLAPPINGQGNVEGWFFDHDRSHFLTWGDGEEVQLWENGENIRKKMIFHHEGIIKKATFSHNGKRIISFIAGESVHVWDVATGKEIAQHKTVGFLSDIIPAPSGNEILIQTGDMYLWNPDTGETKSAMKHDRVIMKTSFFRDGDRILSLGEDRSLRIWDTKTATQKGFAMYTKRIIPKDFCFNEEESRILAGNTTQSLYWDSATGLQLGPTMEHAYGSDVTLAIDTDETHLLTTSGEWITVWPIGTDYDLPLPLLALQTRVLTAVHFDPTTKIQKPLSRRELEQTRAEYLKQAAAHYADCRYPLYNFFSQRFPQEAEKVRTIPIP